uniref:Macaca fascicularis brain cDNA clone: QflA-17935, similar to human hypothetical protein MGC33424 (MGC33424), mRNA, RefSeq: NM_153705.2 n=1 Tax=Macaca fascicularis TaxID=9541 RepID=I7GC07_MACFA|nr:unnamed protein product [Macaca fascicularis]
MRRKSQKMTSFCDICKLYKIQIPVSLNKVLLEHSHTFFFLRTGFHSVAQAGVQWHGHGSL